MEKILKGFDSFLMNFFTYGLLSNEKTQMFFKKSFSHITKT